MDNWYDSIDRSCDMIKLKKDKQDWNTLVIKCESLKADKLYLLEKVNKLQDDKIALLEKIGKQREELLEYRKREVKHLKEKNKKGDKNGK